MITKKISLKNVLKLTHLPIIEVEVLNRHLSFIIDTGSTNSLLDAGIASSLEEVMHYTGKHKLQGIEGNAILSSQGSLPLTFCGKEYQQTFCIMPLQAPFEAIKNDTGIEVHGILGTDFLLANKWVVDFEEEALRVPTATTPFH